jgi:hypothetical protein
VALPPLLLYRIVRNVLRRGDLWRRLLPALPLVILFTLVWSIGELVGYLVGPGTSDEKVR